VAGVESVVTVAGRLSVGVEGVGALTVTNGTVVANEIRAARSPDADATIRVQGGWRSCARPTPSRSASGSCAPRDHGRSVSARGLTVAAFNSTCRPHPESHRDDRRVLTVTDGVEIGNLDEATAPPAALALWTCRAAAGSR
jgi:hypothetical protein